MSKLIFNTARQIWSEVAKSLGSDEFTFEIELHRKLLNFFQVGDFYYYVFNCATSTIEYVSESMNEVLGYAPEDFNVEHIMSLIHPEDVPVFINSEHTSQVFFSKLPTDKIHKYKLRYDYRIRKANGQYIRILQQIIPIQSNTDGGVVRTLGMHTDISHLKKENTSSLSFIGLEGEPSYHNVTLENLFPKTREKLTKREKEVLQLIVKGMKSQEIATELFISKNTVDSHRKRLLSKTECNSTYELISKTIYEGWI